MSLFGPLGPARLLPRSRYMNGKRARKALKPRSFWLYITSDFFSRVTSGSGGSQEAEGVAQDQRIWGCSKLREDHLWRSVRRPSTCRLFSASVPLFTSAHRSVLLFRFCDRCYLQRARLPEGRWWFPGGWSFPQARVCWNYQRQGIKLTATYEWDHTQSIRFQPITLRT